jgi:purine catabolism regulator
MSLPSVQTIQRLALPAGATLVAGGRGLSRGVAWPATLRTRAPGFASLKSGEFLLIATSTLSLLDPNLSLHRLLQSVGRVGIAGAAIVGDITADCRAWADSLDVPLFALPSSTHLPELELSIARAIADARTEFDRRSHDLYRQLAQLAIEERGIGAIVEELSRLTAKSACFLDHTFSQHETHAPPHAPLPAVIPADLKSEVLGWARSAPMSASEPPTRTFGTADRGLVLVAPVLTREGIAGYLAVSGDPATYDELDAAAVAGAAAAAAIELTRERAVVAAQERAQASIFEELVAGTAPLTDSLRRRAARIELDLDDEHTVVATAIRGESVSGAVEAYLRESRAALAGIPAGVVGGLAIFILTGWDRRQAPTIESLRDAAERRTGAKVVSGVGRNLTGLDGLRQSYRDAVEALRLADERGDSGRTSIYADLGLDRLLISVREHPELRRFYDETMARLSLGDGKGDGELIRTLETYFACNGSPTEAATRLHLHRNTLLYRLQRIRSLTEIDLDDPEVRLAVQIALRVRHVLSLNLPGS